MGKGGVDEDPAILTPEMALAKSFYSFVHPDDETLVKSYIETVKSYGSSTCARNIRRPRPFKLTFLMPTRCHGCSAWKTTGFLHVSRVLGASRV